MQDNQDNTNVATAPVVVAPKGVVKLTRTGLVADKDNGLTNPEMATKYGLSPAQISKALKMAGIEKTRAKNKPKFEVTQD